MRLVRSTVLVLIAVATAFAAGACGADERIEYEQRLAKVGTVVDRSLAKVPQDDASAASLEDVRRIAGDLRDAAKQLDELDPPEDAAEAHDQLRSGLSDVAAAFDALADDLDAADSDPKRAEVYVRFATDPDVEAAFERVVSAQEKFAAEGYRVFRTADTRS